GDVAWSLDRDGLLTGWQNARYEAALDAHRIRAPQGEVAVWVFEHAWRAPRQIVELGAEPRVLELPVQPQQGVQLRLLDAGLEVVLEVGWGGAAIEALGHDGRSAGFSGTHRSLYVDQPGRYTVTVPVPAGYAPVPPRPVDVPLGEVVEVVIELERAP
ncbi:MAG TPA: hypothetical protein VJP77_02345, partial [Planctomycetota bacterium]|nr:hypothetical protein [Planctomycetota bacterium]